ncbi:hypothetical protein [Amycolatopsis pigmentata]|uniref:Uncharacterized protein n=1 Tax=Amycolatopsis pigmentata TaxID=450801 RepID=A0ABW5G466_9PSEU
MPAGIVGIVSLTEARTSALLGVFMAVPNGGIAVTSDQVFVGLGLIVVLAVGCQAVARRLGIPALIVLLPVGCVAGALTSRSTQLATRRLPLGRKAARGFHDWE